MSISWTLDIHTKLNFWEQQISPNPLLFENPAANFLLLKMLRLDIQEDMIPSYLRNQFKRSFTIPTKKDLLKSATILNNMMENYGISTHKGVAIIYLRNNSLCLFLLSNPVYILEVNSVVALVSYINCVCSKMI